MTDEIKSTDYALGFRHGSDSEVPDTRGVMSSREHYFAGYIAGVDVRDQRHREGIFGVPRPDWMNEAQYASVNKLYRRSPDGAKDRFDFFTRVQDCSLGSDQHIGIAWCGMFVGIETDGYSHT